MTTVIPQLLDQIRPDYERFAKENARIRALADAKWADVQAAIDRFEKPRDLFEEMKEWARTNLTQPTKGES